MTELEYRQALMSRKPILMFVIDEEAFVKTRWLEPDPLAYGRMRQLRNIVMRQHTGKSFRASEDLAAAVEQSLRSHFRMST